LALITNIKGAYGTIAYFFFNQKVFSLALELFKAWTFHHRQNPRIFFLLSKKDLAKLPRISGKDVVKVLCNNFHFKIENTKGSHITLINRAVRPAIRLIVPAHPEIQTGTLTEIVAKSQVGREAFMEAINS
jgi:predicted RNA binding protein YcfA (HicA-like mRNA interferase family)